MFREPIRRIVDNVAHGQKYHLRVVFADGSAHDTTAIGDPDVTITFRGEQGLRKLVSIGYHKPFGRVERPLTWLERRALEWRQNNRVRAQAKRNAAFQLDVLSIENQSHHYHRSVECWQANLGGAAETFEAAPEEARRQAGAAS